MAATEGNSSNDNPLSFGDAWKAVAGDSWKGIDVEAPRAGTGQKWREWQLDILWAVYEEDKYPPFVLCAQLAKRLRDESKHIRVSESVKADVMSVLTREQERVCGTKKERAS